MVVGSSVNVFVPEAFEGGGGAAACLSRFLALLHLPERRSWSLMVNLCWHGGKVLLVVKSMDCVWCGRRMLCLVSLTVLDNIFYEQWYL